MRSAFAFVILLFGPCLAACSSRAVPTSDRGEQRLRYLLLSE